MISVWVFLLVRLFGYAPFDECSVSVGNVATIEHDKRKAARAGFCTQKYGIVKTDIFIWLAGNNKGIRIEAAVLGRKVPEIWTAKA